jgi:lysophospholipase L1-like esterase
LDGLLSSRENEGASMPFGDHLKSLEISNIRVFGDSITAGLKASQPHLAWPPLFAAEVDGLPIQNHAVPGTVLQGSRLADGKPRPDNGLGRFKQALLDEPHRDAILILYGYNDARYTAAPETMNVRNFTRDYARMLEKLIEAGHGERLAVGSRPTSPMPGSWSAAPASRARRERVSKVMSRSCACWRDASRSSTHLFMRA